MISRCRSLSLLFLLGLISILSSSCVHEFPEINDSVSVRLSIHHLLGWTEADYYVDDDSRAGESARADEGWYAYYRIHVFHKDDTSAPVYVFELNREDIDLNDFTAEIKLPPGQWDIYAWQDFRNSDEIPFYIADSFPEITYRKPYRGDTQWRDAFEGRCRVEVPETIDENPEVYVSMDMERPLARYVFIATDFEKFYTETVTRNSAPSENPESAPAAAPDKLAALSGYSVPARYPLYMPAVYNLFSQRVMESWTGVDFSSRIVPINDNEAIVATDFVFMNHVLSGAQVQLNLLTPDNQLISLTSVINVPLKRGQITYVRGNFLTTTGEGGIGVDYSFSGDINIKL